MPPVIIAAAIAAAATAGTTAYEAHNSDIDEADAAANQKSATQAAANQANLTKQEAVAGAQGQAQQQTGGSLTDAGTASITNLLAGYPGYQGGISGGAGTSTGTGIGASGVSGSGGAGAGQPDISSILSTLLNNGGTGGSGAGSNLAGGLNSNLSGGNWQSPSNAPQQYQELANPPLG